MIFNRSFFIALGIIVASAICGIALGVLYITEGIN